MTDAPEQKAGPVAITLRDSVRDNLIATLPERTRGLVVEHYAAAEADKQAKALIAGLDKLSLLERELNKINRPDNVGYDADGKPVSESFTKGRLDEIKKAKEQIEKLVKAINKADDKGDFGDLYNASK